MNEMVERVARAFSDYFHAQADEYAEWILEHSDDGLAFAFDGSLDMLVLARVAIRALRQPTAAMLAAAHEENAIVVWQEMVDAALKE